MCIIDNDKLADFCSGCGVCAGTCPNNNIKMRVTEQGDLRSYKDGNCIASCTLCKKVCPVIDTQDINNIANKVFTTKVKEKYDERTGYYSNCFVGHVRNERQRLNSASGGLATWTLKKLLEDNEVDRVIAVKSMQGGQNLFAFNIFDNADDLEGAASSAYYPVDIAEAIKHVRSQPDYKYAIIGLPCVVLGIRKAQETNPLLKSRIKYVFSLTCGQMMNRYYPEFIAAKGGISAQEVHSIKFRVKKSNTSAHNFQQIATDKKGKEGVPQKYSVTYLYWKYYFFTHESCLVCDDLFGELADATFMDAWLPNYSNDWKGNSIVILRNIKLDNLYQRNEKEIAVDPIDIDSVIKSQENRVRDRMSLLKGRLYYLNKRGLVVPRRVDPQESIYEKNKRFINLCFKACSESKAKWSRARLQPESFICFMKSLKFLYFMIQILEISNLILFKIKKVTSPR